MGNTSAVTRKTILICAKHLFSDFLLLQNHAFCVLHYKYFLTGTEASSLTVTLLSMEQEAGGGRT